MAGLLIRPAGRGGRRSRWGARNRRDAVAARVDANLAVFVIVDGGGGQRRRGPVSRRCGRGGRHAGRVRRAGGGSSAPAQHVADLVHHRVGFPRLAQLAVRASFLTAGVVVGLLAGRKDEHRNRAQRRVRLDGRAEVVARAARHDAVRDHQVGVVALRQSQPLVGGAGPRHGHVIRARERHGEGFLDRHAVVGNQDALGHRTSELSSSVWGVNCSPTGQIPPDEFWGMMPAR